MKRLPKLLAAAASALLVFRGVAACAEPPEEPDAPQTPAVAVPDAVQFDPVLSGTDKPDAAVLEKVLQEFGNRRAEVREAALRRLAPFPAESRAAVVKQLSAAGLSSRLTALDLLLLWHAPVDGIDPWRADTLTPQRTAALEQWVRSPLKAPAVKPGGLSDADRQLALAELDRLLKVPAEEVPAVLERLDRYREGIVPVVLQRLSRAETDDDRQRLSALRYRLAADQTLALRWPGGLTRLAAPESASRRVAVLQLSQLATAEDQPLLLQLFADADPLVRELALNALQRVGGEEAVSALVKLLEDPDANVRASVLKQLAEHPSDALAAKVALYVQHEKDADLVVHGVRVLKESTSKEARQALVALTKHPSWQVRAEAVEAIGKGPKDHERDRKLDSGMVAAAEALLEDSDGFVVSRALEALSKNGHAPTSETLMKLSQKYPDLAPQVIALLSDHEQRKENLPYLRKFLSSANPDRRAMAIRGIAEMIEDDTGDDLNRALSDQASVVRIAAAEALFNLLETRRDRAYDILSRQNEELDLSYSTPRAVSPGNSVANFVFSVLLGPMASSVSPTAGPVPPGTTVAPPPPPPVKTSPPKAEHPKSEPSPTAKPAASNTNPAAAEAKPALAEKPAPAAKTTAAPAKVVPPSKPGKQAASKEQAASAGEDVSRYDRWLESLAKTADTPGPVESQDNSNPTRVVKGTPEWAVRLRPKLMSMLLASDPAERVAGALALLASGERDRPVDVLLSAAKARPDKVAGAAGALVWLPWPQRLKVFEQLQGLSKDNKPGDLQLIGRMSEVAEQRAEPLFWRMVDQSPAPEAFRELLGALRQAITGSHNYSYSSSETAKYARMAKDLQRRAAGGPESRKRMVLFLLQGIEPAAAAELAEKLLGDKEASDKLKFHAMQVLLVSLPKPENQKRAATLLADSRPEWRNLGLQLLANGPEALQSVDKYGIYLPINSEFTTSYSSEEGLPIIVPERPAGVKAAMVRPLLKDKDATTAALAAYLLCSLGDREGLAPLIAQWRRSGESHWRWDALVYRAIAVLDAGEELPVLKQIYASMKDNSYLTREFYWTIRIMTGPEMLKFRAQIRREVGMQNLR